MSATTRSGQPRSVSRLALTILSVLLALLFLVAAGMKFAAVDFETRNFAHFGYAPWFMYLIAVLELGGAVLLMFDRTRGIAALSMAVIMVGAVASHLRAGDGIGMATPAAVALGLCLVVAYAKRKDFNRSPF